MWIFACFFKDKTKQLPLEIISGPDNLIQKPLTSQVLSHLYQSSNPKLIILFYPKLKTFPHL